MKKHRSINIVRGNWRVSESDLGQILSNYFKVAENAIPGTVKDIIAEISNPERSGSEFWLKSVHYRNYMIKSVALIESTKVREYSRKG